MKDWEKLARACRRYLDAFNDEIADDTVLGSVGNDLRIIANREVRPESGTDLVWGWRASDGEFFVLDNEAQARRFVADCDGRVRLAFARWEVTS